jgi:hypothetical protein
MLRDGDLDFTPKEAPFLFRWTLRTAAGPRAVSVRRWDQRIEGRRAEEWLEKGDLKPGLPHYSLAESAREGRFVGIYGPGPGIAALPLYLPLAALGGSLPADLSAVLWTGKVAASILSAASVVLVFLAAGGRMRRGSAWCVALAYGLGTCAWSQGSQALWQQTPVLFFLSAGIWALLGAPESSRKALLCGAALGAAVLCRATSVIPLLAAAWIWARRGGRLPAWFGLGLLPAVAIFFAYSAFYLESPLDYVHTDAHSTFSLAKTGSMELWQTPLWTGAAGILLSPARGLLVYSPFLALAGWGAWVSWRDPGHRALRPLGLALVGMLAVYARWSDWWGGHSFGYRLVMDTLPLFAVMLFPVADRILGGRAMRRTAGVLLLWSVGVQFVGAFAYDQGGWNARVSGVEVRLPGNTKPVVVATRTEAEALARDRGGRVLGDHELDVDRPEYRSRLWSLADNPISYYAANFSESRAAKRARLRAWLEAR